MSLGDVKDVLVETFHEWRDDDALQWGAALSYYTALAMAPLLVLLFSVAGLVYSEETARQEMVDRIQTWVGSQGAEIAETVLRSDRATDIGASVLSIVFLLVGATGIFAQLQKALNEMWNVEPESGLKRMLRGRLIGFGLVLGIGLLLIAAVLARAILEAVPAPGFAVQALNLGLTIAAFTVVLAAIYKVLPDVQIGWRDVWMGAAVTALFFVLGQVLIGLYLGRSSIGSAYGAAGSLIALLVWIYYSSQTLFFGAEFTQVWARRAGRHLEPEEGARRVREVVVEPEEPAEEEPSGAYP